MNLKLQKTIKDEVRLSGKGLFGGQDVKVIFRPGQENSGIVFVRSDGDEPVRIQATVENIGQRSRRTALMNGSVGIETVEHCLAAISGLGVHNIVVEVEGPEMPGFDGSCGEYCKVISSAGIIEQNEPVKEFTIKEPISVESGDATIYALPHKGEGFNITYDMDYSGHTGIGRQVFGCQVSPESFSSNFATARTFLLEAEAKQFQARGIGKHLSPRDILVINSEGPIRNSFRFPNECVRHKIVDLIGDLALAGREISGRIVAYKSGHSLNQAMAKRLYETAVKQERIAKFGTDAVLDIRRIQKVLPHRYPFLLIDKVIEIEGDKRIRGIKNVSFNEQFFQGHFPGTPIMPGVLMVEAMAQVSGLLFAQKLEHTGKLAVLLGMDSVKLRKAVVPGDQLILVSEVVKARKRTAICKCQALVGDSVAAEAEIKFMLVDDEQL